MNKPLKYALLGVGAVLALIVAAVVVFVATFDPNAYKQKASDAAQAATGRALSIPGELELDLFPWLALRTGRVELGNAPGFEGPFASIESLEARVKVAPLFRGELEIGTVVLRGANVALAVAADGKDNWSDLGQDQGAPAEAPAAGTETVREAPRHYRVEGVRIEDAALAYADARSGATTTVTLGLLETGAIAQGEPIGFTGEAALDSSAPALAAQLRFAGTLTAARALEGLTVEVDAQGAALPAPLVDATITVAEVAPGEPLAVRGIVFKGWGLELGGELTAAAGADGAPGKVSGRFQVAEFAPREVLPKLGIALPQTADPKALSRMTLGFALEQQGDRLALEQLKLELDGSTITGRVALDSIERTALRFDLALDALDADRYLPPPAPAAEPAADGGLETLALPVEPLRGLDLAGTLRAGKLAVAKVDLSDLRVSVQAKDGRLAFKPFGAALYGGKVQGEAALDAREAVPEARVKLALAGVRVGDLMKDAFDSKMVSGVAKLDLDLAGRGATVGALKRDLDGTVGFDLADGALEGFNLWKSVRLAWAKLKGRETPAASEPDRTPFESVRGGATVADGVATLTDVKAAIQFAAVTAKGRIDLGASRLKVEAKAKITAAPEFGPGENLTELKGVTLPVEITGPFAKPKVDVDLTKAATSVLKPERALKKKLKGLIG